MHNCDGLVNTKIQKIKDNSWLIILPNRIENNTIKVTIPLSRMKIKSANVTHSSPINLEDIRLDKLHTVTTNMKTVIVMLVIISYIIYKIYNVTSKDVLEETNQGTGKTE